jgi:hypothetical protein
MGQDAMALKLYERHLAREIYASTALVLAAFLMLFAFFDLIHELESIGKGGYQLQHALGYVTLTLPGRLYELFPIGVLIGTLYALTMLARHSEITVLRAAGLSTRNLLGTLTKIGLVFVALTLAVGEFLAPPAERAAQQLRLKAMGSLVAQEFRSGIVGSETNAHSSMCGRCDPTRRCSTCVCSNSTTGSNCARSARRSGGRYRLWMARGSLEDVVRTVFAGDARPAWKSTAR